MPEALQIRDAREADLPALAALYEASGIDAEGSSDAAAMHVAWQRLQALAPQARVLVAERAGRALGTLTVYTLPLLAHRAAPAALVEDVAVHPQAQGQGIGRALLAAAMAHAADRGCYKLALSSNRRREGAHAFYDALGFERHGISFVVPVDTGAAFSASPA